MSHHIEDLIKQWASKPQDGWVLAVITQIQGSAYRKPGAMMLFHPLGHSIGLVSGGCLEADLSRKAQQAMQLQQIIRCQYDASDETDASYQLGCGGIVDIMLIPLLETNNYGGLPELQSLLSRHGKGFSLMPLLAHGTSAEQFRAQICSEGEAMASFSVSDFKRAGQLTLSSINTLGLALGQAYLVTPISRRPRLAIFGGGVDAQPMASIALQLGWHVDVIDPRTSYARAHDFVGANLYKCRFADLPAAFWSDLDAVVIMTHNLTLDAEAVSLAASSQIRYLALLGPGHRRDRVLDIANISMQQIGCYFSAPAGLALGGELPSSIALSILSQCHGVLFDAKLVALNGVMV
ncbi:XdhC family protein [Shewanella waksmanii]|uniref:XdhC family protein n=1 Tax=Shewanella waksmanii TaxID=213783 RepID=UPI0037366359